ncbi:hypothetical protein [Cryptosporangium phraense]|uniref:DUF4097 domain-containing protein n=1 Tax=Cryptosporangium phraense TaxID=2593070 RepID=A0A545AV40_9ACTN|nr:hypothetical protein [Cryptosporangium phraense]TQS45202.1 hypothetical protein FL583_08855 [Cryptosporangium phraense]
MRSPLTALAAAVLIGCTACTDISSINESSHDRRSFDLPGDSLVVDAGGTDVRLVTGDPGRVQVDRTLTGKATADGNASWSLSGDRLRLRVTCSGFVPDCGGLHVVRVPPRTAVTITSDAPVRAVGPTGALTATVSDSWLRVERPAGPLRLRAQQSVTVTDATSADVRATSDERKVDVAFARPPDHVDAEAAGAVRVTLPPGPETYRITCDCPTKSDPASPRTVVAHGTTAQVRKAP